MKRAFYTPTKKKKKKKKKRRKTRKAGVYNYTHTHTKGAGDTNRTPQNGQLNTLCGEKLQKRKEKLHSKPSI